MKRLLAVLALLLTACAGGQNAPASTGAATQAPKLTVFAAASLTEVLPKISDQTYSFDGSASLVDQLKAGAPADVFVSADKPNMDKAVAAGVVAGTPTQFASNVLVLVTPAGNPAQVTGLDASLEGKKLVACAVGVPCGNATAKLAAQLGLTLKPVSEETKVTDVLGKVSSGEADAGLVYATDARRAGDQVVTIQVPGSKKLPNTYWAAVVKGSKHADAAAGFISTLTGEGRQTLADHGFGEPIG